MSSCIVSFSYNNQALLANRRCVLASTLMGIYPMGKATPGTREKSAVTEEPTQQEELSCPECGAQLPNEAVNFCPKCGAEQQDQQAATNEEPAQPFDEEEPTRRRGPEGPSRGPEGPTRRPSGPSGRISGPSGGPEGPSRRPSGPSGGRRGRRAKEGVERAREGVDRAKEGAAAAKERAQRAKERAQDR